MEPSRESTDIAVIGLAGRFPGAAGIPEFWQNLRDGVESVTTFGHDMLRATGVAEEQLRDPDYVRAGSVLDGHDLFDAGFFGYNARDAALIDPQQRLFLESAWHALEDAGHPPGGFDGPVGVYASANLSTYLLACILAGRAGFANVGEALELIVANDKDYLANRVGFKLGLTGPAVAVQSACSSSLVAVHLACQSLLSYECDMALAGGVALRVPHHTGYRYQDGLIFSRTGHCRPFDARADGTLAGNGLGLVVLRRLEDALADGDRVDAVIRGSAVNNDGSDKAGYTAPGINGQASVIATALGIAQAEPESVSAVEAHGTGTPLGDPIEIAALTKVFGTGPGDRCAIGSVKSNLGHLDSAAGIAGLIKAVLQLRHGELVPSLNFDRPNPEIDFDRTPFYVNTELAAWKANGHPRRIGVSSFGMGGTNAHLVLEEAPERAPAPAPRAVHLLPLSARTPEALAGSAARLAEALTEEDHPAVEDVAHTLQRGRTVFEHRRVLVAGSVGEAAEAAGSLAAAGGRTQPVRGAPRTAWLFTGQGSQYPGMCRGLYDAEPVFRETVDACAELLRPEIGTDLREVLYPDASVPAQEAAQRLRRTEFAQPALFTVEYALATLLQSWGLRPDAMAGHSVGEITAACVAGVLPWEDAARLVARRGRLMQQLPSGAMLSVNLPEDRVREILPGTLDLAAVNAPDLCVVSGPHEEVDAFRERLTEQGHAGRPLHTSHAFHSSMMEPMLEPFAAELESLLSGPPSPPRVRLVSNRTGTWMTDEQAADPAYWVGHVRDAVRFGDAVQLLAGSTDPLALLEIGPGRTLSTLARQCEDTRRATVLHTVPAPDDDAPGHPFLLTAAGRLWSAGLELDWHALNGGGRRVSLPGYAFQRRRYWIEPAAGTDDDAAPLSVIAPADDPADATGGQTLAADPRPDLTTAYCAPRDAAEERLAAIWQDLLGIEPVGVHDHFMELGGHSLLATRMVDRIAAEFGRRLPLREVLRAATVAELAELTGPAPQEGDHGGAVTESGLPAAVPDPGNLYEPFPLSEMQQAQWIGRLASFQGGDTAAHVYWEVESDDLDLERLNHAFNLVMDRHEMLRAVVTPDGTQRILPDVGPYPFDVLDLRAEPADTVAQRLEELRERLSHEVRPADTWPLFDIRATVLPGDRVRLHLGFDLLIADIGSIRLLLADWRRWYENPDAELPRLALSYRDYVLASEAVRETEPYRRSVEYWRERVADLPPAPDLPLAISPDALSRPEFTARTGLLGAQEWERFTDRCASLGLTPSSALLAAYATALGGWTRNGRFTLNVTVINRLPVHPDVSSLVGEFASFDLLPVDLPAADGMADLARQLQAQSWEDLEHRYLNGVEVLRELARSRGGTSGSVMPVVFTSTLVQENDPDDTSMFGWLGEMTHQIAQTPQVWLDFAVLSADGGVELTWHWVRDLFPDGVLEDVFDAFHGIVRALAAEPAAWDVTPALLPEGQRRLVAAANDTAGQVPDGMLFTPLAGQALHHPERPAVFSPTGDLTHGELYRQACGVAHRLRGLGVGPNQLVAVAADKSREQVVAALGVQLAGGAYLPVDPDLPKERQDWLLDHGQARVVLTRAGGPDREDWPDGMRRVVVDLDAGEGADEPPEPVQQPGDLAYVVYTSGSTGTPKGVMVSHRAALNTVVDINERFGVGPEDRVLGLSSLSFDLSVWDVFGVLGAGGALVLPPSEDRRSPERWHRLVNEHRVTVWNSVPALAQMFTDQVAAAEGEPAPPLRLALMSGDWIPVDLPDRMRALMPGLEPVSLGGATEAAVWSIAYPIGEVDPGWDSIPYGRPLRNQTFHVFNDRMTECPVWVTGELYIGGVGVAEGYWREPERTAAQFVTHPVTGERLYRTGDLGRRLPDGNLEFLGREDFQVKIGGYRIELGEIETVLAQHEDIAAAVATAHGTDRHHRRLVGYLVPDPGSRDAAHDDEEAFTERIRAHAQERLPSYMVPAVFVVLDRLPLSGNGKVDRGALPEPGRRRDAAAVDDAVLEGALGRLAEIIAEVVGVPRISATENFFALGGDSITGVQIVSRANSEGIDIALQDLFQAQTLGALAVELGDRLAGGADPAGSGGQAPLTGFQHRLFAQAAPRPPGGAHGVEVKVEACVDSEGAGRALGVLLERHPALRLRFTEQDGTVVQSVADADDEPPYVPEIDLTMLPADRREPAMAEMVGEMREELDPRRGPVVQAALFDLGDDDRRMAWLAHELVADAGSWKVLLAEFFGTLALLDRDAPLPPPPTGSFLPWARQLPDAPEPGRDDGGSGSTPARALLPAPGAAAETAVQRAGFRMDAQQTAAALDAAREAYRMTLDEVLLASVAEALRTAAGTDRFGVDVEFDPRAAVEEFDAAPVVGPFASVVGVPLDLSRAREPEALLGEVKQRYREAADTGRFAGAGAAPPAAGEVLLRSLGDFFPATGSGGHPLAAASRAPWPVLHGRQDGTHSVTVTAVVFQGGLHTEWTAAGDEQTRALLEALATAQRDALRRIRTHCEETGPGRLQSGDFPLAGLDDNELGVVLDDLFAEEDAR